MGQVGVEQKKGGYFGGIGPQVDGRELGRMGGTVKEVTGGLIGVETVRTSGGRCSANCM